MAKKIVQFMVMGLGGPELAARPNQEQFSRLDSLPYDGIFGSARRTYGLELAEQGLTLHEMIDLAHFGYDNSLAIWRNPMVAFRFVAQLGANWAPMPILAGPPPTGAGLPKEYIANNAAPPLGAILVPATRADDPNYNGAIQAPVETPLPPPTPQAVFGARIDRPIPGCLDASMSVGIPVGHTAVNTDGKLYTLIQYKLSPFSSNSLIWLPLG